jgi:hypothetical protein
VVVVLMLPNVSEICRRSCGRCKRGTPQSVHAALKFPHTIGNTSAADGLTSAVYPASVYTVNPPKQARIKSVHLLAASRYSS